MADLKLYQYDKCDTCRKARKYLNANAIPFELIPIREQPPTRDELNQMLTAYKGEIRRLFNTSGVDYRKGEFKNKLPTMSTDEAISALAGNGNLIKRPFLIANQYQLVGFKLDEWDEQLQGSD